MEKEQLLSPLSSYYRHLHNANVEIRDFPDIRRRVWDFQVISADPVPVFGRLVGYSVTGKILENRVSGQKSH